LTAVFIQCIALASYTQNVIEYTSLKLTPHTSEIMEYLEYGFRRNRITTDQIFCIRQILEKNTAVI